MPLVQLATLAANGGRRNRTQRRVVARRFDETAILEIADRTNVTIYDPQADELLRPQRGLVSRLFKRRGS